MLRNVLEDYISKVQERDFDLPFLSLLPAMGFYDIHYTHGQVEFGKDFIAKREEAGVITQYSFQSKAGDISQNDWRSNIMGQMLEAIMIGLAHPCFDKSLPHRSVLVTSGKLTGNASISLQELNGNLIQQYSKLPILLWDKESIIENLEKHGLLGLHTVTASGFVAFGTFYDLYGNNINGKVDETRFEQHFSQWSSENIELTKKILGSILEAEILGQQCRERGFLYEGIFLYLCVLRILLKEMRHASVQEKRFLIELQTQTTKKLYDVCNHYLESFITNWEGAGENLVKMTNSSGGAIVYLVHCARTAEIAGLTYFLEGDTGKRNLIANFIERFMSQEPGSSHIPSDNYAISLVLPIIALARSNKLTTVQDVLHRAVLWLLNRYQEGHGLAPFRAIAEEEINFLFGYPFDFININRLHDSYLATVLLDLLAYLNLTQLYTDTVNDLKAVNIIPQYWQVPDTDALYYVDHEDIVTYPNIDFIDSVGILSDYKYADHVLHELRTYSALQEVSPVTLFGLMILLRDRYFPTIWPFLQ